MPKELGPLTRIEVARTGATLEAELRLGALQHLSRHDGARPFTKPADEKGLVTAPLDDGDESLVAACNPEQPGIHRGWRREDAPGKASCHRELEPGSPVDAELSARPYRRTLVGKPPLDDDVCGRERDNGVKQASQDRRATIERRVCYHLERRSGQLNAQRIVDADIHLGIAAPQAFRQMGIDLDGYDTRAGPYERRRESAGPSTEIENEVARLNARSANQFRCQLATAEKVLAAPARSRSNGHGRPPRP
jgi:hypothetical protein